MGPASSDDGLGITDRSSDSSNEVAAGSEGAAGSSDSLRNTSSLNSDRNGGAVGTGVGLSTDCTGTPSLETH